MALSAIRKIPLAVLLMLGCSAMTLPAQAGWFSSDSKPADSKPAAKPDDKAAAPATNLEDSIRQAQMLRLAGQYPEAIKHLSQLMMVASDDGRVISEYGKTLAAMGRPADAVNFLTRAQQLQPGDWTILSALGVAYDQIGDQKSAQQAYEHALAIKPEEPSVLNNYALSRMLAKDPDMARKLATRAETAGGNSDAKIARNIALIHSLAAGGPVATQVPQAAPQTSVAHNQIPGPAPVQAPAAAQLAHMAPTEAHDNRVVMQRVPVDPLAGPVQPAKTTSAAATHAPHPLQPSLQSQTAEAAKLVATTPSTTPVVKAAEASKPVSVTPTFAPLKLTDTKPAPAKTAEAAKPVPVTPTAAPVKTADTKPAPAKTAEAAKPTAIVTLKMAPPPVKSADVGKPVPAPKVLPPAPVRAVAKAKDAIPGLRLSANAY